ncbi:DUF2268 domain-containing protein [Bacillus sp. FJAT-29937]|uniref:DUF2268 domain-containing protein n=1 Tax=Bacillus sp. FJAT-29937 TaxID=1720553 RepID=UPI000B2FA436|nr:DUF2268 domain-containing putative Zn-dependent protease [Bacillus sp. FJAT-29937]
MGVIRTDLWLEEDFYNYEKICARLAKSFSDNSPNKIYKYLSQFGMYKPNRQSYENFTELKKRNYWEKTEEIFRKYKKKWKGSDIPIYIFPMASINSLFSRSKKAKSGVAFNDKIFLFLSPFENDLELEALFIHEYHHTCRLNHQNKKIEDSTLIDSIILEGLAEHAVKEYCGKEYVAHWSENYSKKEILYFWERFLKQQITTKRLSKLHDDILYGRGTYPKMLGYSAGFVIVSMYKEEKDLTLQQSFRLDSESFITGLLKEKTAE